jgi:hypothetical protein
MPTVAAGGFVTRHALCVASHKTLNLSARSLQCSASCSNALLWPFVRGCRAPFAFFAWGYLLCASSLRLVLCRVSMSMFFYDAMFPARSFRGARGRRETRADEAAAARAQTLRPRRTARGMSA